MTSISHSGSADALDSIFNSAVVAHAISRADQLGMLDRLERDGYLSVHALDGVAPSIADAIVELLELVEVVEVNDQGHALPGLKFERALLVKGFFSWLFGGSGAVLEPEALPASERGSNRLMRNARLIGQSCADFGGRNIDGVVEQLDIWRAGQLVLDLGCADGSRLVRLARQQGVRGLGLDIAAESLQEGVKKILEYNLQGEIRLEYGDVRSPDAVTLDTRGVDVLTMFLMGHDLWPEVDAVSILSAWRRRCPKAQWLVLCETARSEDARKQLETTQIPVLGFEYLHALMGQYIPTFGQWENVLERSGWVLRKRVYLDVPASTQILISSPIVA